MNQETILWLIAQSAALLGAMVTAYIGVVQRLTRLETTIALIGVKAARVLHSPHTPQLDRLLEKYIDRNYELTSEEWQELLGRCQAIEDDLSNPKDQRALAAIVSAVCSHKLSKIPPIFKAHYSEPDSIKH